MEIQSSNPQPEYNIKLRNDNHLIGLINTVVYKRYEQIWTGDIEWLELLITVSPSARKEANFRLVNAIHCSYFIKILLLIFFPGLLY